MVVSRVVSLNHIQFICTDPQLQTEEVPLGHREEAQVTEDRDHILWWERVTEGRGHILWWERVTEGGGHILWWERVTEGGGHILWWERVTEGGDHILWWERVIITIALPSPTTQCTYTA